MKTPTIEKNGTDTTKPDADTAAYYAPPEAAPPATKSGMDVYEMDAVDVPVPAFGEIDAVIAQQALGSLQWQLLLSASHARAQAEAHQAKDMQIASLKEENAGLKRRLTQQAG